MFFVFIATGLESVSVAGPGSGPVSQGVDLLGALALHNTSRQGVKPAQGPQQLRPAYYLEGNYTKIPFETSD